MALRFTLEERFAVSPERVFAAVTDLEGFGRWMPGFVRVQKLDDGPVKLGTRFLESRKMFGREATEHFEITAFDPPRKIELFVDGTKGTSKKGAYRFTYTFSPADGGTLMTLDGEVDGMGWVANLLAPLFAGTFKKALAKDHAALRSHLNAQAKDQNQTSSDTKVPQSLDPP